MTRTNTSDRLKQIMRERSLKQVHILGLCKPYCERSGVKLNKNDLSQYVSGKVSPREAKLAVLALALGVSEIWLLGYDDPADRSAPEFLSDKELKIALAYRAHPEMHDAIDRLLCI